MAPKLALKMALKVLTFQHWIPLLQFLVDYGSSYIVSKKQTDTTVEFVLKLKLLWKKLEIHVCA